MSLVKVSELIAKLQTVDQDAYVLCAEPHGQVQYIESLDILEYNNAVITVSGDENIISYNSNKVYHIDEKVIKDNCKIVVIDINQSV
jgi:hypothetical protein